MPRNQAPPHAYAMDAPAEQQAAKPIAGGRWLLSRLIAPLALAGRDRREGLRMADTMREVSRVLVILPLESSARQQLLPQFFAFKGNFPDWVFDLFFLGGEVPPSQGALREVGIIQAGLDDISLLGLPRRSLVARLKESGYQLVIDLSMDAHPFVPYLVCRMGAPLRMGVNGFGGLHSRRYNLLIRLPGDQDLLARLAATLAPICKGNSD